MFIIQIKDGWSQEKISYRKSNELFKRKIEKIIKNWCILYLRRNIKKLQWRWKEGLHHISKSLV